MIKGINLEGLRVLGDPSDFVNLYYKQGADEICYLDNVATLYGTNNLSKFITRTAKNIFVPLTVGGGIKTLYDIENMLNAGADKISINSAGIENTKLIYNASRLFGSSTISINIEFVNFKEKTFITKSSGRDIVFINPAEWAKSSHLELEKYVLHLLTMRVYKMVLILKTLKKYLKMSRYQCWLMVAVETLIMFWI